MTTPTVPAQTLVLVFGGAAPGAPGGRSVQPRRPRRSCPCRTWCRPAPGEAARRGQRDRLGAEPPAAAGWPVRRRRAPGRFDPVRPVDQDASPPGRSRCARLATASPRSSSATTWWWSAASGPTASAWPPPRSTTPKSFAFVTEMKAEARSGATVTPLPNLSMMVLGGTTETGSSSAIEIYQPRSASRAPCSSGRSPPFARPPGTAGPWSPAIWAGASGSGRRCWRWPAWAWTSCRCSTCSGYDFAFALGPAGRVRRGRRRARRGRPPPAGAADGRCAAAAAVLRTGVRGRAGGCWCCRWLLSLLNALRVRNCNLGAGLAFYVLLPVAQRALRRAGWARWPAGGCPRGGRLVALPAARGVDRLDAAAPVPRSAGVRVRSVRRLLPRARSTTRRCARRERLLLLPPGQPGLDGRRGRRCQRRRVRAAAPRRRRAAGGARPGRCWPLALLVGRRWRCSRSAAPLGLSRRRTATCSRCCAARPRSPHFVVHSDPGRRRHARGSRAGDARPRVPLPRSCARTLGVEPAGPVTVYLFPSAEREEGRWWARAARCTPSRGRARSSCRPIASRPAACATSWPTCSPARSAIPCSASRWRWRLPLPRLASGLVEGIAEAADFGDPDGRATVHQEARAMIAAGLAPPLAKVVGAGFTTAGGRARLHHGRLVLAISCCQPTAPDKLRALYRSGGDFAGVYGEPLRDAGGASGARFLETPAAGRPASGPAPASASGARPSSRRCARASWPRGWSAARGRLYSLPERGGGPACSSVCQDDPGEPSYRLDLAEALFAAGRADRALAVARRDERGRRRDRAAAGPRRQLAANIHYHAGRFAEARRRGQPRAQALATDEGEQRTAMARTARPGRPDRARDPGPRPVRRQPHPRGRRRRW